MHSKCWILVWQMGSRNCTWTVRINYRITDYKLENFTYVTPHDITCLTSRHASHASQDRSRIILFTGCAPLNFAFIHLLPPANQGIRLLAVINISASHTSCMIKKNILWAYRHETGPWSISWHASGSAALVSFIIWAVFLPASKKTRKLLELGQSVLYCIHRSGLFWCTLGLCCYETELICHSIFAHPIYA